MSLEKILRAALSSNDDNVVKTVPVKKEWQEALDKLKETAKESEIAEAKRLRAKNLFWGMVEEDLDDYSNMKLNEDKTEVLILKD